MGILATFFGAPKVVGAIADTVKAGVGMLDNAFYTEQEKSAMALKTGELWLKIQGAIADENSIRSVIRRVLAWMIMGSFVSLIIFACLIWKLYPFWAEYIKTTIVDTQLGYLALLVGFFYFGYYGVKGVMKK